MRANVLSIPALRDLKAGILKFQQDAQGGLEAAQMELHKLIAWIEQDRPAYWNSQVRRAFDQVAATRAALMSCQMRTVGGHRPACSAPLARSAAIDSSVSLPSSIALFFGSLHLA